MKLIPFILLIPFFAHSQTVATGTTLNNMLVIEVPRVSGIDASNIASASYATGQKTQALFYPVPARVLAGGKKIGVIFYTHGRGESGTNITNLFNHGIPKWIAAGQTPIYVNGTDTTWFFVICPQDNINAFSVEYGTGMEYVVPYILANYAVDTNSINFCGLSAGGRSVYSEICKSTNTYARQIEAIVAASPGAGLVSSSNFQRIATNGIWHQEFSGTLDQNAGATFDIAKQYYAKISSYNPPKWNVFDSIVGGKHNDHTWDSAFDARSKSFGGHNIYWFFKQAAKTTATPVPPTANANNITITAPISTATLDGSASSNYTTVLWTQVSGASCTITNSNNIIANVSGLTVGSYSFKLTLTNTSGSATKTITVTVNNPPQPVANLVAVPNSVTLTGSSVTITLDARATAGASVTYAVSKVSGASCTINNANTNLATAVITTAGTYVFQVIATNTGGSDTATATALVIEPNYLAPSVIVPSSYSVYSPQDTLQLSATITDINTPPVLILSQTWELITGPSDAAIDTPDSASTWVRGLVEGVYQFKITATNTKNYSTSKTVIVYVNAQINETCSCP